MTTWHSVTERESETGNKMSDNNTVRRTEGVDGGAVYSVELASDAEAVIARASELHGCTREAIIATALAAYIGAFDETLRLARLAMAKRDDGPRH